MPGKLDDPTTVAVEAHVSKRLGRIRDELGYSNRNQVLEDLIILRNALAKDGETGAETVRRISKRD